MFFNHPVARKDLKFNRTKLPFAILTDRCAYRLKAFDLHREDCSRKKKKKKKKKKKLERENKQIIPDRFHDRQVLRCYSFHETVPRQCRFLIPNSLSKRVYRIKG